MRGVDGELKRIAEAALTTKPNFAYTLNEIQEDIGRVFDTGYFTKTVPISEDTRDGVKLTIEVWGRWGGGGGVEWLVCILLVCVLNACVF